MNLIQIWDAINEARELGNQIADPSKWADRATRVGLLARALMLLVAAMGALNLIDPALVSQTDMGALANGFVVGGGLVSMVLHGITQRLHEASNPNAGRLPSPPGGGNR